jgi:T5orf172 domain
MEQRTMMEIVDPPEEEEQPLDPSIARLIEIIALDAARKDHERDEEALRNSPVLLTTKEATRFAQCSTIGQFRLLVDEGIFPKPAVANKRWIQGPLKRAFDSALAVARAKSDVRNAVYFVERADSIKIGYSKNVEGRVSTLQTASASKLVVIHTMKGDRHTEALVHKQFSHLRQHGEWFRKTDGLLAYIDWLKAWGER